MFMWYNKSKEANCIVITNYKPRYYVHTHFRENISLGALASQFSYSPNYTGMIFKQNTGMSFNRYLNHIRLKYACNMLRFSSFPIKDIALMAGYSSVEHFLYTFKKHIGCTPLEYRKQENTNTKGIRLI